MSTTGKVFVIFVLLVSLAFFYFAGAVLEGRRQWSAAIVKKEVAVHDATLKVIEVKLHPAELKEFQAQLKEAAIPASDRKNLDTKAATDLADRQKMDDAIAKFDLAVQEFNQSKSRTSFHQALDELVRAHSEANPQADEIAARKKSYDDAVIQLENDLKAFEQAFTEFTRTMRDLFGAGKGIDAVANSAVRIQRARTYIETWKNVQLSDYSVAATRYNDLLREMQSRSVQIKKNADDAAETKKLRLEEAEPDREKLGLSEEQLREEINERKLASLSPPSIQALPEQEIRDALRQDLGEPDLKFVHHPAALKVLLDDDLKKAGEINTDVASKKAALEKKLADTLAENRKLVIQVARLEAEVDRRRGLPTIVIGENGAVPKGTIQKVDDKNGTVEINLGMTVGVTPGVRLHAYRFEPEPKYLGMIEVTKSESDRSIAKILPAFQQLTLQTGDIVSSEIKR